MIQPLGQIEAIQPMFKPSFVKLQNDNSQSLNYCEKSSKQKSSLFELLPATLRLTFSLTLSADFGQVPLSFPTVSYLPGCPYKHQAHLSSCPPPPTSQGSPGHWMVQRWQVHKL